MDWKLQPEVFKHYPPEFISVSLEKHPELRDFLYLCCGITARKQYPSGSYSLRVNPSAGALYPCELYLQARRVQGLTDGIYHVEPSTLNLRRLHVLSLDEGIEAYSDKQDNMLEGLTLLVTAIYYRSSWKYGSRALRYCLLDSGHMLGAIEAAASCFDYPCSFVTCFNRRQLQADFGFKDQEMPMVMVNCGRRQATRAVRPEIQLPFISGSGSFVRDSVIETAFNEICNFTPGKTGNGGTPYNTMAPDLLSSTIIQRRSIRSFRRNFIDHYQYRTVLDTAAAGLDIDCEEPLTMFGVVHRVEGVEPGIYTDDHCLRSGDFSDFAGYLCLEQALGAESAVTLFLTGGSGNYLPLMLKAGVIGHRVYLSSVAVGLGCSGIGAFYDREAADFLGIDSDILYALAFGR